MSIGSQRITKINHIQTNRSNNAAFSSSQSKLKVAMSQNEEVGHIFSHRRRDRIRARANITGVKEVIMLVIIKQNNGSVSISN